MATYHMAMHSCILLHCQPTCSAFFSLKLLAPLYWGRCRGKKHDLIGGVQARSSRGLGQHAPYDTATPNARSRFGPEPITYIELSSQ